MQFSHRPSLRALSAVLVLAFAACSQRPEPPGGEEGALSERSAPRPDCFVAGDGHCVVGGLTVERAFRLSDSLYAFHRSGRLELDRLTKTNWQLLEEVPLAPPALLEGVLSAMEETAPEVVSDFRATHPSPFTSREHERYLASLFAAYLAADVDLSDRDVPDYEPPEDIQIEVIGEADTNDEAREL